MSGFGTIDPSELEKGTALWLEGIGKVRFVRVADDDINIIVRAQNGMRKVVDPDDCEVLDE